MVHAAGVRLRAKPAADLGLAVLVTVVVGAAVSANVDAEAAQPGVAAYGFGAVFGALMLVRRRWPTATLLVTSAALLLYYVLSYPPIGLAVPVAAALYSAAEQGKLRWAVGTAAGLLAVSSTARILDGDDPMFVLGFEFASSAGLMAAVIALGDSVRSRQGWRAELLKQARAAELERERLAAHRVAQERVRLARDLHDVLGHTVSVISLHADVAREALHDDPDAAARSLTAVRTACSHAVGELRATLGALRSPVGDHSPAPSICDVSALVEPVAAAGVQVRMHVTGAQRSLPAVADVTAYRTLQEALHNVLRHAAADSVSVEIDYGADELLLRVRDDGRGGHGDLDAASQGLGIVGMRERLSLLGGDLRAEPRPTGGFDVEARIPLQEAT